MPHPLLITADALHSRGLLAERAYIESLLSPTFPFAEEVRAASSLHLHIKVPDTALVPLDPAWTTDLSRPGFLAVAAGRGVGVSFSSIPISDDERGARRPQRPPPFLDHIGLDLPDESDLLPIRAKAASLRWPHTQQGGRGRPVSCCYASVAAKLWVFPPVEDGRDIAIEFSFGAVCEQVNDMGEDLRPSRPDGRDKVSP